MTRSRFITIEGGEGSGKSTLITGLSKQLDRLDIQHLITREPGGTPLAESVRALVLNPPDGAEWSPLAEALLMNAARRDHIEKKILPALKDGMWVICDRFADSTRVYQGIGGVSTSALDAMENEVTRASRPDLTLILDGPVDQLLARREQRGTSDVFERRPVAFHESVRKAFLEIAEANEDRCVVLNALASPEELVTDAMIAIKYRLLDN